MKTTTAFKSAFLAITFFSLVLISCGMTAGYDNFDTNFDYGVAYKVDSTNISTLPSNVSTTQLMAVGETCMYFFDVQNLKIYACSLQGIYAETISLPSSLAAGYFHGSTHLGGGYDWYSRAFTCHNNNLYLFGFPSNQYLKYTVETRIWETVACNIKLPKKIIRNIRKNGDNGWIIESCDYVIPHGYVDYVYTHLNDDFTARHNNFSGDEGEDYFFGYKSNSSYGIYSLNTAVTQDTENYTYFEITPTRILFGYSMGNGKGYYVDQKLQLYRYTLDIKQ